MGELIKSFSICASFESSKKTWRYLTNHDIKLLLSYTEHNWLSDSIKYEWMSSSILSFRFYLFFWFVKETALRIKSFITHSKYLKVKRSDLIFLCVQEMEANNEIFTCQKSSDREEKR